ncbi:sulfurtransferase [Thermoflavimicrobium daqui]|uniref:Sulfurtransferase n=1 Tax=Thermoflavimicrobium daqui TaxID=2137476 RepID=A0A364K5Y8_9BACL|nr:sulfurtransferase [Thermoflavimicrobium daqui]RAL25729.1 sulfurtransferase [Thermoflavimicrobium daqui]
MTDIISPQWLFDHLNDANLVIVDCRFVLGQPNTGLKAYQEKHIPGAYYLDMEKDLSGSVEKHGGRHPIPRQDLLAKKLGNIGINEQTHVIAYDDQQGAMASRLWWLLKYLGHDQVSILDGGWKQWIKHGFPITNTLPSNSPTIFTPKLQKNMLATMEEVLKKLDQTDMILIDSREEKRYSGEEEPIDPVAGHIPSAINYFWQGVLKDTGIWKERDELEAHFQSLPKDKEIIVYCGSGITATPNFLALKLAGYQKVKLYAGSWSDWITHPQNPIEKEKR